MNCKSPDCHSAQVHGSLYCFACLPKVLEQRNAKRKAYMSKYRKNHREQLNAYMRGYLPEYRKQALKKQKVGHDR